jgi:hypothetical protein
MVNIDSKLDIMQNMVNKGQYFVINRPRQYGKTTAMYLLEERLKDEYIVISCSFEGIGNTIFSDETYFSSKILEVMAEGLEFTNEAAANVLREVNVNLKDIMEVSSAITKFIRKINKKVVLLIDEVDKSSNNQLFLNFLGMLRSKYLAAKKKRDLTFRSVILAGVHDIKNLKLKIRDGEELKLNSPWNIAVNFNVDMSFSAAEIETMLKEYSKLNNIPMDTKMLSKKLYYYTNGYPFLVSRLCQIIDEKLLREKGTWNLGHLEKALKLILKENNTLFDDLIKNLENNKPLNDYIFDIVLNGADKLFNSDNPLIQQGSLYGILKEYNGFVKVSNRVFEQRIYNYYSSKLETTINNMTLYNFKENFINKDNSLNLEKILLKFQQFMKEQYSTIDREFIEREGRLLFLAFIKPIINGVGFDFKEVQISEEKRLDVVITYNNFKYIIELKIWNGPKYHEKGLNQLYNYIDNQGLDKGYLVIYNFNKSKEYKQENISFKDKDIFAVYV